MERAEKGRQLEEMAEEWRLLEETAKKQHQLEEIATERSQLRFKTVGAVSRGTVLELKAMNSKTVVYPRIGNRD